ncbi:MAG TPA: creatininase family protein [Magnetospirillaceae bacterium]|nr:creatininase family protein [Magnetospirillaceae bacterium]
MKLAELTWAEARDADAELIFLPVGSLEQHGLHLPLNNDTFVAERLADLMAAELSKLGRTALVAPAIPIGLSSHHMGFYGSLTLGVETFQAVIAEVCRGLCGHGFRRIAVVNGHGGNSKALRRAAMSLEGEVSIVILEYWRHLGAAALQQIESAFLCHACEGETSVSLALGQRGRMEKAASSYPVAGKSDYNLLDSRNQGGILLPLIHTISESGAIGDPSLATREKGDRMLKAILADMLEVLSGKRAVLGVGEPAC